MRKILTMMLSVILMSSIISCNNTGKKDIAEEDNLAYNTIMVKQSDDSLRIKFNFVIDFPIQGPDSLVNEIKKNIFFSLGDSTCNDLTENGLNSIAEKYINESREELKDLQNGTDASFAASYAYEGSIKIMDNTEKYVTYYTNSYIYSGGAHGMPYKGYVTIDKNTYKTLSLGDIIAVDKMEELKTLVKSNIVNQYYEGTQPNWEDEMFKFNLPQQTPAITTEGVIFCYGAYEIDCFAAGMPYCVIPFDDIIDLMTPEAKALIK